MTLTVDDFYAALSSVGGPWYLEGGGELRDGESRCPIEAVYDRPRGWFAQNIVADTGTVLELTGMGFDDLWTIVYAADRNGVKHFDPAVRDELLRATGVMERPLPEDLQRRIKEGTWLKK